MPKTETSGDDAAEECSTFVNWEEDPAIKAEWQRRRRKVAKPHLAGSSKSFQFENH